MFPKEKSQQILEMANKDKLLLAKVAAEKNLSDTYHEELKTLHNNNIDILQEIVEQYSWPSVSEVGEEVAKACWLVLQHGIERPDFMRKMLFLFKNDDSLGVDKANIARLEDRIRVFEGKKQLYGTNFDWTEDGVLEPTPIENVDQVEELRKTVGLPPLADDLRRVRNIGEKSPKNWSEKQKQATEWAIRIGWRNF